MTDRMTDAGIVQDDLVSARLDEVHKYVKCCSSDDGLFYSFTLENGRYSVYVRSGDYSTVWVAPLNKSFEELTTEEPEGNI